MSGFRLEHALIVGALMLLVHLALQAAEGKADGWIKRTF
jgi:hypothetical protein